MSEDFSLEEHKKTVQAIRTRSIARRVQSSLREGLKGFIEEEFPMFNDLVVTGPDENGQINASYTVTVPQPVDYIALEVSLGEH